MLTRTTTMNEASIQHLQNPARFLVCLDRWKAGGKPPRLAAQLAWYLAALNFQVPQALAWIASSDPLPEYTPTQAADQIDYVKSLILHKYNAPATASPVSPNIDIPAIPLPVTFVSYAHEDIRWINALLAMLAPALRNNALDLWHDARIDPGNDWRREIDAAIQRASVAVLLVSTSFLASHFIVNHELPLLIEAANHNRLKLTWILLDHCLHERNRFSDYHALHDISKPLAYLDRPDKDRTLKKIACELLKLVAQSPNSKSAATLPQS